MKSLDGDIHFWKHIVLGQRSAEIISKRGWQFELANFYAIRQGKYVDLEGHVIFKSKGYKINFLQPLKLLLVLAPPKTENGVILKLLRNLNFEYHYSVYEGEETLLHNTKFNSYVISLTNWNL